MKKMPFLLLFLGIMLSSCRNDAGFEILSATYTYEVNDCITNQGYTGTSIDVRLSLDPVNADLVETIQVKYIFSSGQEFYEVLYPEQHFLFLNGNSQVFIPWCFYFDQSSYVDHYYTIFTHNDKETKTIKLRVNRPPGAN